MIDAMRPEHRALVREHGLKRAKAIISQARATSAAA